jgi:hypothetical protein
MQNFSAFFAWAILLSSAMLPDVSSTKQMFFGIGASSTPPIRGAIRAMKYPSSP